MKHIQLLRGAHAELKEAVNFYRSRDERIAARFVTAIDSHIKDIASHPDRAPMAIGTKGPTRYRRLKVRDFPFGIIYRMRDDIVEVVAIAHERRRPGYWPKR